MHCNKKFLAFLYAIYEYRFISTEKESISEISENALSYSDWKFFDYFARFSSSFITVANLWSLLTLS